MKQYRSPSLVSVNLLLACVLLCAGLAQAAKPRPAGAAKSAPAAHMHKCTSADGSVRYTDNPGPDCAESVELSKHGVVVESAAPAKNTGNPGQTDAAKAEKVAAARRDKTILATYTSETQIEEARARNLEPPLQAVKLGQTRVDRSRSQLDSLKKQADALKRQNKPLPAGLNEDIRHKEAQVAQLESDLAGKQARVDEISARFDADLQRFRELKGAKPPR